MYELSTAISYILPRRKNFSIGIIGLLATIAISAIVWVILVFFSVSEKFEERWSEKIQSILGTIRIEVNPLVYRNLPENRIDLLSANASYRMRRLSDLSLRTPFIWEEGIDEPLSKLLNDELTQVQKGSKKRLACELRDNLIKKGLSISAFETLVAELTFRTHTHNSECTDSSPNTSISQYSYIIGRDSFHLPAINRYTTHLYAWDSESCMIFLQHLEKNPKLFNIFKLSPFIIQGIFTQPLPEKNEIKQNSDIPFQAFPIVAEDNSSIYIDIYPKDNRSEKIARLSISEFITRTTCTDVLTDESMYTIENNVVDLPLEYIPRAGYPIYLPKQFLQTGLKLMSEGVITLSAQDSSQKNKQSKGLPVFVAGFYDTGVLSVGAKVAIISASAINSLSNVFPVTKDPFTTSSIIITAQTGQYQSANRLTNLVETAVKEVSNDDAVLRITHYRDLDLTKDLFQQLASEKNLFRLIALILLSAASSNIFCMLFILVHTKSKEIAILRALGSSKKSIQIIFTVAGAILGIFGATLGIVAASITLYFLPEILQILGTLQGQEVLQSSIYGAILKEKIDINTLIFTLVLTSFTSSVAGWLASLKACQLDISNALRNS